MSAAPAATPQRSASSRRSAAKSGRNFSIALTPSSRTHPCAEKPATTRRNISEPACAGITANPVGSTTTAPWAVWPRRMVASVVGEEDGGTGTLATILRGHTAHGAVVVEPTGLAVIPAQAGSLMFRLVVAGFSAHGCVREEGVSAIEKFLPLFAALRRLEAERCGVAAGAADMAGNPHSPLFARYRLPWPIEIGTLRAGDWASSVPISIGHGSR